MEQITEQLVGQLLEEKQVYLDNARLKHGVPRHHPGGDADAARAPVSRPPETASVLRDVVQQAAPVATRSSFLKTAAMLGLTAAAGAVGIPPIVSSIAGHWIGQTVEQAPATKDVQEQPEDWNDLVNWLREEGLDHGKQ